jgi:mono/diheme cytochrome c family protein
MDVILSASLGLLFLVVGTAAVFLMYYLWGFPFDKATRTSAAPPSLMRLHRQLGWFYILIYIVLMFEMVPRMWNYQVEWPARTVAHMCLGMGVGFILLIKVAILRFFRHLEEWMPALGTALLACTIMLAGLSMPHAFREMALASEMGDVYGDDNRARVKRLLESAKLPEEAPVDELSSVDSLQAGRQVLLKKCVACHDLKTILDRPRSPLDWVGTVDRMVIKPSFNEPISEFEGWQVTAYMIAISRDLQRSLKERRAQEEQRAQADAVLAAPPPSAEAVATATEPAAPRPVDEVAARKAYESVCSQCHELSEVEKVPPTSEAEVVEVIRRMVDDNEMKATPEQVSLIEWHMIKVFVHRG